MHILWGQFLKRNNSIVLIYHVKHTTVKTDIYEIDLSEVKLGQVIEVIIVRFPFLFGLVLVRSFMYRGAEVYFFFYNFC